MEDYDKWVSQLKQNKMLSASDVEKLVIKAKEVLTKEPNVPVVRSPVTVCGDIHGQFYDLIELFKICGEPPVSQSLGRLVLLIFLVFEFSFHGRLRG